MPFGIKPASEEYQHRHGEILGLKNVETIHDDILIMRYGETTQEPLENQGQNLENLLNDVEKRILNSTRKEQNFE